VRHPHKARDDGPGGSQHVGGEIELRGDVRVERAGLATASGYLAPGGLHHLSESFDQKRWPPESIERKGVSLLEVKSSFLWLAGALPNKFSCEGKRNTAVARLNCPWTAYLFFEHH
jgi:hypothetical protein